MPIPMSIPTNAEKPMPRFPNGRFPGFCQFCMEKKELYSVEIKTLYYDFPYFLIYIRPFDLISSYNNTSLSWYLHVQSQQ